MGSRVRLAVGAIALIAGASIFCLSISLWTRDRLHAPGAMAEVCLREGEVPRVRGDAQRYLAYIATRARHVGPPPFTTRAAHFLVSRLGFLLLPDAERQRLIGTIRTCGAPPAVS